MELDKKDIKHLNDILDTKYGLQAMSNKTEKRETQHHLRMWSETKGNRRRKRFS